MTRGDGPARSRRLRQDHRSVHAVAAGTLAVGLSIPPLLVELGPLALFVTSTVLSELAFAAMAGVFVVVTGVGYLRLYGPTAVTTTLVVLFGRSPLLWYRYARTENVVRPDPRPRPL